MMHKERMLKAERIMDTLPTFTGYDGHFVSPLLAVGRCPLPKDVAAIEGAGIRAILNLVAVCEARSIDYVHHLPKSIYWQHLAFWDGHMGANQNGYNERLTEGYARYVVEKAAVVLRDRSPVLVHCMGGGWASREPDRHSSCGLRRLDAR